MKASTHNPEERSSRSMRPRGAGLALLALALPATLGAACSLIVMGPERGQQTFDSPQAATAALFAATERDDPDAVREILGRKHSERIVGQEWEASREGNLQIVQAAKQKLAYSDREDGSVEILIGEAEWPFPIPVVDGRGGWYFDTKGGMEEIRDRRIGRDELVAIEIAKAYVDAQIEYANADWNGDGMLEYAQRILSTPGERDGLFWPIEDDEPESPFGQLVSENEEHIDTLAPGEAVRGYQYRVLTAQGSNPPGGAYSYVVGSRMVAGFALVVHPDVYGDTGIMTFVTSHHGRVYEKDRGTDAAPIDQFDPDDSWARVE